MTMNERKESLIANAPRLGDLDAAIWTVRNDAGEIVAEFRTEEAALEYGSRLANAEPNECFTVVVGRWNPVPPWQTPKPVS